mmetsp:Transcript_17066/g.35527  ORF Transcript_17066/g.35527 Transcript_17066/m.35527 type:complete len:111 (+) Transcript_17066:1750-2082(+)
METLALFFIPLGFDPLVQFYSSVMFIPNSCVPSTLNTDDQSSLDDSVLPMGCYLGPFRSTSRFVTDMESDIIGQGLTSCLVALVKAGVGKYHAGAKEESPSSGCGCNSCQ